MKCFVALIFLSAYVYGSDESYFRKLDAITPEPPCNAAGGVCTFAADCPQLTEESGLCPNQRSQGVECCNGVSVRETRCQKLGGECMSPSDGCGREIERATDCSSNTRCCLLV